MDLYPDLWMALYSDPWAQQNQLSRLGSSLSQQQTAYQQAAYQQAAYGNSLGRALLEYRSLLPDENPKEWFKSFHDELQSEIDEWLRDAL